MKKAVGLTLVELLFGLVLLSIALLMILPADSLLYQKNQVASRVNEMTNAIHYARTLALLSGSPLAMTPLPNSNDWSEGMILFVDNKNHAYTTKDKILHQWQWLRNDLQIQWQGFYSNHYLLFSTELKHAATSGHFDIYNDKSRVKLVVNRFGRVSRYIAP